VPYFGGKITLGPRIAALLPAHRHYVEPFCGSLAVLLAKGRSPMETVNDLDGDLVTFWRILRERQADLAQVCALTPHSRAEYVGVLDDMDSWRAGAGAEPDDLETARRVFVQLTQGRAGTRRRSGWRHYVDPVGSGSSMPDYLDGYVGRVLAAAERLAGVSLECRPALDLIERYGRERDVLLYVDPPYLGSTRNARGRRRGEHWGHYLHDMPSEAAHAEMGRALAACSSAVVVSGYASDLYDKDIFAGWDRLEFQSSTGQGSHAEPGRSAMNRTEVLWSNRPLGRPQLDIFDCEDESS
jgi:DNA adenine methylase